VSGTVVEVGGADEGGERFHWAFVPETRFTVDRLGSPSEVNPALAPRGFRSFAVEFAHRGPADTQAFIAQALQGLEECGLARKPGVVLVRARTIPVAYVLFDHAHAAARETVYQHLRSHSAVPAGRYGNWEYSSMEDALLSGQAAARAQ
jgi:protoporphyrinogen oxidase